MVLQNFVVLTTLRLCCCSIREMCGTEDVDISYCHFKAFYELFTTIDQLAIDS